MHLLLLFILYLPSLLLRKLLLEWSPILSVWFHLIDLLSLHRRFNWDARRSYILKALPHRVGVTPPMILIGYLIFDHTPNRRSIIATRVNCLTPMPLLPQLLSVSLRSIYQGACCPVSSILFFSESVVTLCRNSSESQPARFSDSSSAYYSSRGQGCGPGSPSIIPWGNISLFRDGSFETSPSWVINRLEEATVRPFGVHLSPR